MQRVLQMLISQSSISLNLTVNSPFLNEFLTIDLKMMKIIRNIYLLKGRKYTIVEFGGSNCLR